MYDFKYKSGYLSALILLMRAMASPAQARIQANGASEQIDIGANAKLRGMTGRRWWILLAVVALIGGGYFFVNALLPATRFIYGLAPVGLNEALLLTRRNESDATYFWAQLVKDDGSVAWSREVTPLHTREALGFTGVAASADRIVLLGEREGTTVVKALARGDGEPQWETALAQGESNHIGPMLIIDGPRVYALHGIGEQRYETLTALALSDGAVLWTLDPAVEKHRPRLHFALIEPGRLLVSDASATGAVEYDGATGRVVRTLPLHSKCDTPRTIIGDRIGAVVVMPRAGRAVEPVHLTGAGRGALTGPCGERGDDVIIGQSTGDGSTNIGLARVDGRSGDVRWRLDFGRRMFGEAIRGNGQLPRFLPLVVFGSELADGPILTQVVVVDLDAGSIVSRNPVSEHMLPFVTAGRGYVMAPFARVMFALDPETGALASATRLDGTSGNDVRAEDFRFGRLWLIGKNFGRPSELGWAVLDLESARPLHLNGGLGAVDVTARGWPQER